MISHEVRTVSTQIEPVMNDLDVQCIINQFNYADKDEAFQPDYESNKSEYHQSEGKCDDETFSEGPSNCSTNTPSKTAYNVYWFNQFPIGC